MSTLAPIPSSRTLDYSNRPLSVLIRVPRLELTRTTARPVRGRRRLRREVRWAAQFVGAIGLFSLGLAVGHPGTASAVPSVATLSAEVPPEPLPAAPAPNHDVRATVPSLVVLKGILPDDEAEDDYHAGR